MCFKKRKKAQTENNSDRNKEKGKTKFNKPMRAVVCEWSYIQEVVETLYEGICTTILKPTRKRLYSYTQTTPLKCLGYFEVEIRL